MNYFATNYTIHFDDTMAYGSHHFLTSFKFQCAARESLLFGEQVFDVPGVKAALDTVHLLTADAYTRNLHPAQLGERVAILLTVEEWQRASARFCFRVLSAQGEPICAGFQTLICADAATGRTCPLPPPLRDALDKLRCISEADSDPSFRDRVLAGGSGAESLFGEMERDAAKAFLSERHPAPGVVTAVQTHAPPARDEVQLSEMGEPSETQAAEAWVFAGQGAFDAPLLCERVTAYSRPPQGRRELDACADVARELLGGDAHAMVSGSLQDCSAAMEATPDLKQVAIHLQNVLGARLLLSRGRRPSFLTGHSFGEIAAFELAGCFDLQTGVRVVCHRVRAIAQHEPAGGGLLAVLADRATVTTELPLHDLWQLVVAGRNHPSQTVVSGPQDQLDRLRTAFQQIGVSSVAVPTATSFHHPKLRAAAAAWLKELRRLPLKPPSQPLYSPNGRRFIASDDDVAATLASQLLKPFDLQGAINDLVNEGVAKFVDCGSPGSLAKIMAKSASDQVVVCGAEGSDEAEQPEDAPTNASDANPPDHSLHPVNGGTHSIRVNPTEIPAAPPVVVVGSGCLLPAGARTPATLFQAIMEQRSGIVDQRDFDPHWSEDFFSQELVPDRSTSPLTGRVDDHDLAPPPELESAEYDGFSRAQKLLAQALMPCADAIAGAKRVLCLVGATADGFNDHDLAHALGFSGVDSRSSIAMQRLKLTRASHQAPHDAIQAVFDRVIRPGLEVVLVDAACASSLYTVGLGMRALQNGEADAVIAGGVFCPGPANSCLFSQFRAATATGLRPFDAGADGVVFSEGAAVCVLRRMSDAVRLELPISAVVKGVGLSSDGRSSSANVPQSHGQLLALQRCYDNYQIAPDSITAVEGHGTSTPVGDSTELETLRQFFSPHLRQPLPVHSLKGLLGHTGWAAGTASIIAACEYLRSGQFPAQAGLREPSQKLIECRDSLVAPTQPLSLPPGRRGVAINGFGFGGANAHVVLEAYDRQTASEAADARAPHFAEEDELVFVAASELSPTVQTDQGRRFDRANLELPSGHVLLPDLEDDMDISQKLAISLVDGIVSQIPSFEDGCRRETGIVLAFSGKTERSVEATTRVLSHRLRRQFADVESVASALAAAHDSLRPSGPYTLQCMMPNVASGRAALQFNCNGPNFVVDAGKRSLEATWETVKLLLNPGAESGTKVVIASAIHANPWRLAKEDAAGPADEFAAAFAVTTRGYAKKQRLTILADFSVTVPIVSESAADSTANTGQKVRALLDRLRGETVTPAPTPDSPADQGDEPAPPIHVPVWVEALEATDLPASPRNRDAAILALARPSDLSDITQALAGHCRDYRVLIVGPSNREFVEETHDPRIIVPSLDEHSSAQTALASLSEFEPDVVIAVERVSSWDQRETLNQLATDNRLCELLFFASQQYADRLRRGALGLFGLVVDGWNNGVVHPASGPFAGLLKSIQREIAESRVATVCTKGHSIAAALARVIGLAEQRCAEVEIAYDGETRLVRRLRQSPHEDEVDSAPTIALDSNSVVVATGGARGVTSVLVEALLRDYGCTVVALGRSPLEAGPIDFDDPTTETDYYSQFMREHPDASPAAMRRHYERARARWEAHRRIEDLAAANDHASHAGDSGEPRRGSGCIEYQVADVTDRGQVAAAIEKIVKKHGRIDLLVHGAGVQFSKRLCDRTLQDFRQTFSVKVTGLSNLVEACHAQLGKVVSAHLLTSAYSIFGNDGQHDYGAANETLDRLCCLAGKADEASWSSIAWLAWDGLGMTRGSEYSVLSKQRQLTMLSAEDGRQIFREVAAGRTGSEINVPMSATEQLRYQVPLLPGRMHATSGRIVEMSVDLSRMASLCHHKVRGVPTLPGAWILDQMVVAALKLCEPQGQITSVTVEDAVFHRFVKRHEDGPQHHLRVVAEHRGDHVQVWMAGDISHPSGAMLAKDTLFAEATISFQSTAINMQSILPGVEMRNGERGPQSVTDPYCRGADHEVALSGPFDCVRDIVINPTGRCARYAPEAGDVETRGIPGLVLDAALRVGAMYANPDANALYVPQRIGRLVVPMGAATKEFSQLPHEIRTTAPVVENGHVRWERTEALGERGDLHLVLDNALATRLR